MSKKAKRNILPHEPKEELVNPEDAFKDAKRLLEAHKIAEAEGISDNDQTDRSEDSASSAKSDFDSLFQQVTKDYLYGKLTLGEAAELLGLSRWEYEQRLQELGLVQESEPRTSAEIEASQALIEELRCQ